MSAHDPVPTEAGTDAVPDLLIDPALRVEQVASTELLDCPAEAPLHEVASRMAERRCSSIVVTDQRGEPLGIWTERDALAVDFSTPESFNRQVREVMSHPVRTITAGTTLQEVALRFRQESVRHYLVVDEAGRHTGVISQSDLVANHSIEHYLRLRKVRDAVGRPVLVLDGDAHLAETAARMREGGMDAVVVRDPDGTLGIVTERDMVRLIGERHTGERVGDVASRPLRTVHADESLFRVRSLLLESRLRHIGVTDSAGELTGLLSFTDIISGMELAYVHELQDALKERDRCLAISQRHLRLAEKVIESSLEGVMITDADGVIESVNPAFTRLTGYASEEAVGRTPAILSSGHHDEDFYRGFWAKLRREGHWQGEIWNRRKNGEIYPELMTVTEITDEEGRVTHYAALFSDITELKEADEHIRNLAYYDPLTHLPNRRLLIDRLNMAVAHAHRNQRMMAVLFIDLDRFKPINDSLGHSVGDQLLQEVARRLVDCVREDDTVARIGGDEFVCILSDLEGPDGAADVAGRVRTALHAPVKAGGHEVEVTASIGISLYPGDGRNGEALLKSADAAMYRAKEAGRDGYRFHPASG